MKSLLKKIFGRDKAEEPKEKTYEKVENKTEEPPQNSYQKLFKELANEAKSQNKYYDGDMKFSENSTYLEIKKLKPDEKALIYISLCQTIYSLGSKNPHYRSENYKECMIYENLAALLIRSKTKFSDAQLLYLMNFYRTKLYRHRKFSDWPIGYTVIQFEKHVKENGLSEEIKSGIEDILTWKEFDYSTGYYGSDLNKAKLKLQNLIFDKDDPNQKVLPYKFSLEDPFGSFANKKLSSLNDELRNNVYQALYLTTACNGSKPTKKYQTASKEIVDKISPQKYKDFVHQLIEFLINLKESEHVTTHTYDGQEYSYSRYVFLNDKNSTCMKGIVWSLLQFHDTKTLDLLAKLTERAFKKIPGLGPTAAGLGNACIYCLAYTKGLEGVSHLSRLKLKITQNNTQKLIQKYIEDISDKRGISSAEIEEMAVPDFNLIDGKLQAEFDDYSLILTIEKVGKTSLQWLKPDGSPQKSVPAFIKNSAKLSEKLKKIKAVNKQVQKYSTAQRDRIDRAFIQNREWTYENFEKYYHNHGLVSFISKKLLWVFSLDSGAKVVGIWHEDQWQEANGQPIEGINENTKVTLWHPLDVEAGEVIAWRVRLEQLQIQQPLKQAYREVYILTEAELNTRSYSNRMAAHILKQHQLNALTGLRGWKYSLLGCYDDCRDNEIANISIKEWGISAEFWINEVYSDDAFNDAGIWLYVATDQVRFLDRDNQIMNLIDVPKIVFSEIMRDVDLFVGVCSVGNDPNWSDNGGLPQYRDYWQSYSFGDLTELAKTRKTVLERLLPRLKIKNVAKIDGKFLIVKGKIRTYKIHIGSSNILMEPNDQYLCIVPSRKKDTKTEKLFLPFEGDQGMSVVLSKAFLLADDDKITDSTITSQIGRG